MPGAESVAPPPGFEPEPLEPKSKVLPLHHGGSPWHSLMSEVLVAMKAPAVCAAIGHLRVVVQARREPGDGYQPRGLPPFGGSSRRSAPTRGSLRAHDLAHSGSGLIVCPDSAVIGLPKVVRHVGFGGSTAMMSDVRDAQCCASTGRSMVAAWFDALPH